jgi:hypothetical protein
MPAARVGSASWMRRALDLARAISPGGVFPLEGTRKKKVKFCHSAIGTRDQVKLGSRSEDCTGMGDRRLGVFESEAQEQELSQVELLRELLREAQGWLQGAGQTIDILSDAPGAPRANTDDGRQRVHAYRTGLSAYLNKISTQLAGPLSLLHCHCKTKRHAGRPRPPPR